MSDDADESSDDVQSLAMNDDDSSNESEILDSDGDCITETQQRPESLKIGDLNEIETEHDSDFEAHSIDDPKRNDPGSKSSEAPSPKQVKVKVPMAKMTQVAIGLFISGAILIVIGITIDSIYVTDFEKFKQLQALSFNICCGGILVLLVAPIPLMIGQKDTKLRKQKVIIKQLEEKGDESGELKKYMSTIKINKENDIIRNWSILGIALGFISFVMAVVYFFDYGEDACVGFCGLGTVILILSGMNIFRIEKKSGTDWALIVIVILVVLQIVPLLFMSLTESW